MKKKISKQLFPKVLRNIEMTTQKFWMEKKVPPFEVKHSKKKGRSLHTNTHIPKGDIIGLYLCKRIPKEA